MSGATVGETFTNMSALGTDRILNAVSERKDEMVKGAADFFLDTCSEILNRAGENISEAVTSIASFFTDLFEKVRDYFVTSFDKDCDDFLDLADKCKIQVTLALSLFGNKILDLCGSDFMGFFKGASFAIFDSDEYCWDLPWASYFGTELDSESLSGEWSHSDEFIYAEGQSGGTFDMGLDEIRKISKLVGSISAISLKSIDSKYATTITSVCSAAPDLYELCVKAFNAIAYAITEDPKYLGVTDVVTTIKSLIVEAQCVVSDPKLAGKTTADPKFIRKIRDLTTRMQTFEVEAGTVLSKPELRTLSICFSKYITQITKICAGCQDLEILKGQRRTPGYILFCGEAGHGKSVVSSHLARCIYAMEKELGNTKCTTDFNPFSVYTPSGDGFYEGYFNQCIVTDPEQFSVRDPQKTTEKLERILKEVSSEACPVPMAFEGKGKTYYNSDWLIGSTNAAISSFSNKGLEDSDAFFRRLTIPVTVQRWKECVDSKDLQDPTKVDDYWKFLIPRTRDPSFKAFNKLLKRYSDAGYKLTSLNPWTKKMSTHNYFLSFTDLCRLCYLYALDQRDMTTIENSIYNFSDESYTNFLNKILDKEGKNIPKPLAFKGKVSDLPDLKSRHLTFINNFTDEAVRFDPGDKNPVAEGHCDECGDQTNCIYRELAGKLFSDTEDCTELFWAYYFLLNRARVESGETPTFEYIGAMNLALRWADMSMSERMKVFNNFDLMQQAAGNLFDNLLDSNGDTDYDFLIEKFAGELISCIILPKGMNYSVLVRRDVDVELTESFEAFAKFERDVLNLYTLGKNNPFRPYIAGIMPTFVMHGFDLTPREIAMLVLAVIGLLVVITAFSLAASSIYHNWLDNPVLDAAADNLATKPPDKGSEEKFVSSSSKLDAAAIVEAYQMGISEASSGQSFDPHKYRLKQQKARQGNQTYKQAKKLTSRANNPGKLRGFGQVNSERFAAGHGLKRQTMGTAVKIANNMRYIHLYEGAVKVGGAHLGALGQALYTTASHVFLTTDWTRFAITSYEDAPMSGAKFYARDDVILHQLSDTRDGVIMQFKSYVSKQTSEPFLRKHMYSSLEHLVSEIEFLQVFRVAMLPAASAARGSAYFFDELHDAEWVDPSITLKVNVASPKGNLIKNGKRCFSWNRNGYISVAEGGGEPGDCGDYWIGQHIKTGVVKVLGCHFGMDSCKNAVVYPIFESDFPAFTAAGHSEIVPYLTNFVHTDQNQSYHVRGYDGVGVAPKFYPSEGDTELIPSPMIEQCVKTGKPFPYQVLSMPAIRRQRTNADGEIISPFSKTDKGINNGIRPEFPPFVRKALMDKNWSAICDGYWRSTKAVKCRFNLRRSYLWL